jgi:hypothetical protein
MPKARQDDQYSDKEAQRRFEKTLSGALKTPPKRMKDIPLKRKAAKRYQIPVDHASFEGVVEFLRSFPDLIDASEAPAA